jgi:hypothetical protein
MKRFIAILAIVLLLFLFSGNVFAQNLDGELITTSLYPFLLNASLSGSNINQPVFPKVWAIVFNIIPGFGLGSYLEGNTIAGNIQLTSSIVGVTLGSILITYGMVGGQTDNGSILGGNEVMIGWTLVGVGVGGGIIFGVIASLLYDPASSISLSPADRVWGFCFIPNGVGYRFAF